MKYSTVFFDFDGTLNRSGPGILAATRETLVHLGRSDLAALSDDVMNKLVGPPLRVGFHDILGMDEESSTSAVEHYRTVANTVGMSLIKPFDGVMDMLASLKDAGAVLGLVTAKVQSTAEEQVKHFGYEPYLSIVRGAYSDGNGSKSELLSLAIDALGLDKTACVMVGDRMYDIEAANEVGIDSIAVLYGYGDMEELSACSPTYTVETVSALKQLLLTL